jgi:hypothetical protein
MRRLFFLCFTVAGCATPQTEAERDREAIEQARTPTTGDSRGYPAPGAGGQLAVGLLKALTRSP